jgi:DNA polymerase-3 subunit delta'
MAQRAHALLLVGAPGVGALECQLTLAQAWLCEAEPPGAAPAPPCGRCAACRLVQARTHADLRILLPEAQRVARGWEAAADAGDGGAGKRKPSRWIRIAEVRDAIDWIVTTSARGRAKVLLVHPAEALQWEAASALLKTLEEPPAGARLLLSCSDPERLLPTVRSRCQRVALPAPPTAMATAWLMAQGVGDPAVLLAAAAGRPLEALALHAAGVDAAAWTALPRALASGQAQAWAGWPLPRALDALHKLCHDLLAAAVGGAPVYFPADSLPVPGRGAAAAGDVVASRVRALSAWAQALARPLRHAEHPWNEALLIESLVDQGRRALATLRA